MAIRPESDPLDNLETDLMEIVAVDDLFVPIPDDQSELVDKIRAELAATGQVPMPTVEEEDDEDDGYFELGEEADAIIDIPRNERTPEQKARFEAILQAAQEARRQARMTQLQSAPFCYTVFFERDRLGVTQTLGDALHLLALTHPQGMGNEILAAVGTREYIVPREVYTTPHPMTREQANLFIEKQLAQLKQLTESQSPFAYPLAAQIAFTYRYDEDDPREKQIDDFLAHLPRTFKTRQQIDENWWQSMQAERMTDQPAKGRYNREVGWLPRPSWKSRLWRSVKRYLSFNNLLIATVALLTIAYWIKMLLK